MLSVLRSIWNGLTGFFSIVATVLGFIPRFFRALWSFFTMLSDFVGFLPASLGVLAAIVLVVAVAFLVLGR